MTTNSKMRSDFEAWASDKGLFPRAITRSGDGYLLTKTHTDWISWQAALSQQPAQESNQKYTFGQLTNLMMAAATNEGHKVTMRIKWAEQKNEALKLKLAAMEPKP